jgi:hypothetical protein
MIFVFRKIAFTPSPSAGLANGFVAGRAARAISGVVVFAKIAFTPSPSCAKFPFEPPEIGRGIPGARILVAVLRHEGVGEH